MAQTPGAVTRPPDGGSGTGGDTRDRDAPGEDAGAGRRVPPTVPPAGSRIPGGPVGILLAAIVAVIAIAGVVVLTGDDDTAGPGQEVAADGDDASSEDPSAEDPTTDDQAADGGADDVDDGATGSATGDATTGGTGGDDTATDADIPEPSGDTPVEATEAFLAAVSEADCVEIIAWVTPNTYESAGQTAAQAIVECANDPTSAQALGNTDFGAVSLVSEEGDTATVAVVVTLDGEEATREFVLRRVDGRWRLDLLASGAGGG